MMFRTKELRKLRQWTQEDLAEIAEVSRSYIAAIESRNIDKSPSMGTLVKIADGLEVEVSDLFAGRRTVPLSGRVGAGQFIETFGDDIDCVARPQGASKETVAVEVSGSFMLPVYENGTILFYSKKLPPEEMINRRCVVKLASGEMLVKILKRGSTPEYWTLQSINLQTEDIEDVVVEWVSPIDWIKPRGE